VGRNSEASGVKDDAGVGCTKKDHESIHKLSGKN